MAKLGRPLSDEEVRRAVAQLGASNIMSGPVTGTGISGRGGTLTSLISEAGGTGGALTGAALGTALLPGIGTIIGGGLGGLIGGFGGRAAENKIRDDEFRIGDAAKEGAISGLFGAGPLRLLKGGVGASRALAAGTTGASELAKVFGKAGTTKGLLKGFSKAAAGLGDDVAKGVTGSIDDIGKTQLAALRQQLLPTGAKGKVPTTAQNNFVKTLAKHGNLGSKDAYQLSQGYDDIVGSVVKQVDDVTNAATKTVSTDDFLKKVTSLGNKVGKPGTLTRSNFDDTIRQGLDAAGITPGQQATATQLNAFKRALNTDLVKVKGKDKLISLSNKDLGLLEIGKQTDNAIASTLDDASRKAYKGLNKDIATLLDDGNRSLLERAGQEAQSFGGFLGRVPGISRATTRGKQRLAGKIASGGRGSLSGELASRVPQDLQGSLLQRTLGATPSAMGRIPGQIAAGQISSGLDQFQQTGRQQEALQQLIEQSRPDEQAAIMELLQGGEAETTGIEQQMGMGAQQQPDTLAGALSDPAVVQQLMLEDLMTTGGKNISKLKTIASFGGSSKSKLTSEQQKLANNANSALSDIDVMLGQMSQDPSVITKSLAPDPFGISSRALGTGAFEDARKNVADVLGRLRSGGAINADELDTFMSLLPSGFDTPERAESKLARLQTLMNAFSNPAAAAQIGYQTPDLYDQAEEEF